MERLVPSSRLLSSSSPPSSSSSRQRRWIFLTLVGVASSLLACFAFYTSMDLASRHEDELFHPPLPKKAVAQEHEGDVDRTQGRIAENEQRETTVDQHSEESKDHQAMKVEKEQRAEITQKQQHKSKIQQQEPSEQQQQQSGDTHHHHKQTKHSENTVDNNHNNKPLNILVFYGDDWRHDQLGHLNPLIQSPNIDNEIAAKGIRFTHNCVTTSVCGVSRATFHTGQYMSRHGTNRTIELFRPWSELFPSFLKQAGYHMVYVGKAGLFPFHGEQYDKCNMFDGYHMDEKEDNGRHITQRAEDVSIRLLKKRPRHKPFYMTVAFYATHAVDEDPRQYIPMNHSMALYQDTVIPIPITATEESWKRMPPFFSEHNEARQRWHKRYDEPEKHQSMMRNMYRLITEVDTAVGNILNVLEKQGAIDNTLIIFTTDNGNFHSEHGLADKWYPHQESIRVPLLIRDPRMAEALRNTTNDALTLNVDLAATILRASNLPVPSYYQGRDVSELYLLPPQPYHNMVVQPQPWRTEFFYEFPGLNEDWVPASQALVRKDYKYMLWTDHDFEQFFDLVRDPMEDHDVFHEAEYQDITREMKARFLELRAEAR